LSSTTLERLAEALADRYRLDHELGRGGMATVYLAEDLKHHRRVAIKALHPELSAVIGSERFLKEIELTANLQHPHILGLFDSGDADGLLYYVMPYVEGETLRHRLERERQLPVPDAVRLAREVADALDYAHRHKVVHRDIKPENILVQGGHALVADFGIALAVQQAGGTRITQTGMSLGTPQYMAPEQAMGDKAVDHRADIYALAAVTYEMLIGEAPFAGPTSQAVVAKVMTEDPKPLVIQRRSIPESLERAVLTGLEKLPADRFGTAAEFASALAAAESTPRPPAAHSRPATRRWVVPAMAAALAAVAFWAGTLATPRSPSTIALGRATAVTWDPGLEVHPAISRDGRLVAYAAGVAATRLRVFVRPVAGGRSVPLVDDTTQTQSAPRWSPDGTRVLFLARGGAYSAPSSGGPPRSEVPARQEPISWADWAPDARSIGFVAADSVWVRAVGGESRFVASLREPSLCNWSPSGRFLACASGNLQYANAGLQFANLSPSQIVRIDVASGAVDSLTDRASSNQSPVWMSDDRILFISNRHGPSDIYSLALGGGQPTARPVRVTTGLDAHSISLSADAGLVAYAMFTASSNIWALPIPVRGPVSPYESRQVTWGNQLVESYSVSHDGKWLVYDSNLNGNADIYRVPVEGGEPERITTDPADDFFPHLSPDGREVAFHSWRTGNRDIFVQPLDGGTVQQVTATPGRQEVNANWSPDGSALAFFEFESLWDTLARSSVWVARRTGAGAWGQPVQRVERGNWAAWSPDGAMLAYGVGSTAARIYTVGAMAGEPTLIYDAQAAGGPLAEQLAWAADGRSIYFKSHDASGRASVWGLPAAGGTPRLLTLFDDPSRPSSRYNLAVDSLNLYFAIEERRSDIWVMDIEKPSR